MTDETGPDQERDDEVEVHARPFADFLQEQRQGSLHLELSEKLHELVDAVLGTAKAGSLTLTFKIKPGTRGYSDTVIITDKVDMKAPEPEREEALFFVDRHGNLTRQNPTQPSLPLRTVPQPERRISAEDEMGASS